MVQRNKNMTKLHTNYLFPEISLRKKQFLKQNPEAKIINLGIGDTTQPIPEPITHLLKQAASNLGTAEGYTGYGPEQGLQELREKIASKVYQNLVHSDEIFISDGAKCDLGRLQALFGPHASIAVQDPAYPVYIDGSVIHGVDQITYMGCSPENHFFPDLNRLKRTDLIYFCSPNNPTGTVASRQQLENLVAFAQANRSIILFDSAYAAYIRDPSFPKSIFEIEGARNVAIEIGSFSKIAGFTGVRLGWTVVPEELRYEDGTFVKPDWKRLTSTIFNGASNIAQAGGCAVLEEAGMNGVSSLIAFYLENASLLKSTLESLGYEVFGGTDAPYLWVRFKGHKSWDAFQHLLEKYHVVTTPGAGFGPLGEGFIRFSSYAYREHILEVRNRLLNNRY